MTCPDVIRPQNLRIEHKTCRQKCQVAHNTLPHPCLVVIVTLVLELIFNNVSVHLFSHFLYTRTPTTVVPCY